MPHSLRFVHGVFKIVCGFVRGHIALLSLESNPSSTLVFAHLVVPVIRHLQIVSRCAVWALVWYLVHTVQELEQTNVIISRIILKNNEETHN